MSDNVPKALCEQQMKNAYLDIPAEVWTDIFKLLPRRTLVQRVQPVNKVFKAICDRNVKSVHVILKFYEFIWEFGRNEPVAQRQLEALAGHNCALAGHFRIIGIKINDSDRKEFLQETLAVLRHSLDLFRHCKLHFDCAEQFLALAYLTVLEPAKPSFVHIDMEVSGDQTHLSELLRHPTTLNCPRITVIILTGNIHASDDREATFDWLHHQGDMEEEHGEEVRCLNFLSDGVDQDKAFVQWLLEQSVKNFEQSKVPEDRSCFVLTFYRKEHANSLDNFERKNTATGEVLLLERVLREGEQTKFYRLLRCSASRVANGTEQLFAKLFTYSFNFLERAGEVAIVEIY